MKLGFTGTRRGLSELQVMVLARVLTALHPKQFLHGDCVGSDEAAHDLVRIIEPTCEIILHPPMKEGTRARTRPDKSHPPRPYLQRNRDIVDGCDILVATPGGPERTRSGTWSTVRYAHKEGVPTIVVMP